LVEHRRGSARRATRRPAAEQWGAGASIKPIRQMPRTRPTWTLASWELQG